MWTDETEASLRKWVTEGYSFVQISELMYREHSADFSEKACATKAARLGIKRLSKLHDGLRRASIKSAGPVELAPQPLVEVVFDAPHGAAQAVSALHSDQCKYPIGEGADFHFCPSRRRGGSVYCEAHHGRCYIKPDPKRKGIQRGVEKASGAMWGWA